MIFTYQRRFILSICFLTVLFLPSGVTAQPQTGVTFERGLRQTLQSAGSGEYIVILQEQADLRPAYAIADWQERGRFVFNALRTTAAQTQAPIHELLTKQQAAGDVTSFRSLLIVNGFLVTSGVATFDLLTTQSQVVRLERDRKVPQPELLLRQADRLSQVNAVEWGVAQIGADAIWRDFGVRGEGVVVANIDSGVEYLHPALVNSYRGNLGDGLFVHDYHWFDPFLPAQFVPVAYDWHGTHTMGTIVGDGGADGQVGIAPGARWIAATGSTSIGGGLLSAEWLLAPYPVEQGVSHGDPDQRPHIISNSWNIRGIGDTTYSGAIAAWRAAGIIPIFSAGNFGYEPRTINSPSDNCQVIAVGATDQSDMIAYWSGKGPGFYADCPDKPDFTAPGVNIRSAIPGGYFPIDGTSMAAPHVAGCAALLLSLKPELTYEQLYQLLQASAVDLGAPGYDPNYGYGRIDCYAAATAATFLHVTPTEVNLCVDSSPATFTVRVVEREAGPPPVRLTIADAPSGALATLDATVVTPTTAALVTTTLTISAAPSVAAGVYPIHIVGETSSRIHTSTVSVGILTDVPLAPALQEPSNGAINTGRQPIFTWVGTLATTYRLEVASDPLFTTLVYRYTVSGESHQIRTRLDFDTTYYWRVTPSNQCGWGAPSATNQFVAETQVLHVDQRAVGAANGATWADAFPDLNTALAIADQASEIWVMAGTYSPGDSAEATFLLRDGVRVYGGFQGAASQRTDRLADPATNQTVLDGAGVNNHVVSSFYISTTTVLDGFTIRGGHAVSPTIVGGPAGGGLYLVRSSPVLRNLLVTNNYTEGSGGGMFLSGGTPRLEKIHFVENQAQAGGGFYCFCDRAVLRDLVVLRNRVTILGGGLIVFGDDNTLVNIVIAGNRAYNGGGAVIQNLSLANAVVVGNQADMLAGGIWSTGASPKLSQVTIVGNRAGLAGGIYHNAYSWLPPFHLANAILWQNSPTPFQIEGQAGMLIENSLLPNGCPLNATCSGNIVAAPPRLIRMPTWGADEEWGTADDDYGDLRLLANSPALDAGANSAVPPDWVDLDSDGNSGEIMPFDLVGAPRLVDVAAADTGSGTPPLVDLGAYEAVFTPVNTPTPTRSPTTTSTVTPTITPTITPSMTPSMTLTATPTDIPTDIPTGTPTATATAVVTDEETPIATTPPTVTPTLSSTEIPTVTVTPSPPPGQTKNQLYLPWITAFD